MMIKTGSIFQSLLTLTLVFIAVTSSFGQINSLDIANPDSLLEYFADDPTELTQELWEEIDIPTLNNHFRFRIIDPAEGNRSNHYLRYSHQSDRSYFGFLIQRDLNEPDNLDLVRFSYSNRIKGIDFSIGDFRIDSGLGWIVKSSPAWPSSDPYASSRDISKGLRSNLSSEEGRGWKGIGISQKWQTYGTVFESIQTHIWGGFAKYDAFQDNNAWSIYSTQGDHTKNENKFENEVREDHFGLTSGFNFAVFPFNLELTRLYSRFDHELSANQATRFTMNGNSVGATALYLYNNNKVKSYRWKTEISYQDQNAWGGGFVAGKEVSDVGFIVLNGWRATQNFSTLHSRPEKPFGSNPSGKSGLQLTVDIKNTILENFIIGSAYESRELHLENSVSSIANFFISANRELDDFRRVELRISGATTEFEYGENSFRISNRARFVHETQSQREDIRIEYVKSLDGEGKLISLNHLQLFDSGIRTSVSLTYLKQSGTDASLTVIEPSGPGVFPVRRLGGERLRVATRIDFNIFKSGTFWISGSGNHLLNNYEASDPNSTTVTLGFEWRV
jgi:hypothetical protein